MPSVLDRIGEAVQAMLAPSPAPPRSRVLFPNDESGELEAHGVDLLGQSRGSALSRRLAKDNGTLAETYAAVFAAIRWREQAITRPQIVLQERSGGEWKEIGTLDEPNAHPALLAISQPNAATTSRQGRGGIERGKLTFGDHFWIKRRNGFRVPVEFEIWDGSTTRAIAKKGKPWEPDHFEHLRRADGVWVVVDPADVVWFRHIVDPRNPMRSLTPIGAIRVQADSAYEAHRSQLRYFDQGLRPGAWLVPEIEGMGPAELERIRARINEEAAGTDEWYQYRLLEARLRLLQDPMSNVDLQFVEMLRWGVVEVARAFEVSPITLKDFEKATYTNADQAGAQDWETVRNQLDSTLDEFNAWLIRPDFGADLRLAARYAGIGPLQDSMKTAAEVDDIKLKGGRVTINELRRRDGDEPVAWGDIPIMPSNMLPLGERPEAPPAAAAPPEEPLGEPAAEEGRAALREALAIIERTAPPGQRRHLKNEVRKAFAR